MIIKALVENTSISEELMVEHGLSLYIETKEQKILFDLGQKNLFIQNAKTMGVDIADIDLVIISHGHYDHGGGLDTFIQENSKGKIYIHKKAFEKYFSRQHNGDIIDVGINEHLKDNQRIIFTEDYHRINGQLELFSNVKGKDLYSQSNKVLLMEDDNGDLSEDTFDHEQNLIITIGDTTVLIGGCAHKGIVNIVNHFKNIKGKFPNYAISGFHLYNSSVKKTEDPALINKIGKYLLETKSTYYTCHCTGLEAFTQLKELMKDKINYLATGTVVKI